MNTTWIIAADGNRARIFEEMEGQRLHEVDDLINPEGRELEQEINSDKKRYFAKTGAPGHTAEPRMNPEEHADWLFSKQVGDYLDKASVEHRYDKLCVIAPPKFLGLLRENMGEHAKQALDQEIPKDIAWFSEHDVEQYLRQRPH